VTPVTYVRTEEPVISSRKRKATRESGIKTMTTIEDVRKAEMAMNEVQKALKAYTEQESSPPDRSLRRYLDAELKAATENYEKAIRELSSNQAPTAKKQE
jgi:acyl-CoA synthetase (NDP forming)